jgi:hypothetical protein
VVNIVALGLLGGHVRDGACSGRLCRDVGLAFLLGESEVGDGHAAAGRDHDIGALDVAVDKTLRVGVVEAGGGLNCNVEDLLGRQRAFRRYLPERSTLEIGHGDERVAVRVDDLVYRAYIGVVESGGRFGLLHQPHFHIVAPKRFVG